MKSKEDYDEQNREIDREYEALREKFWEEHGRDPDAQELHDFAMSLSEIKPDPGSRKRLEALLKEKSGSSEEQSQPEQLDPIESAMRNNPGLTREKAEEMAEDLGF
jgi:hypothetical protein